MVERRLMRTGLLPNLLAGAALVVLGLLVGRCSGRAPDVVIVPDTIAARKYREERDEARRLLEVARGERDGLSGAVDRLQATIRGLEERRPERVVVYDTLIVADTVFLQAKINGAGQLTLIRALPDSAGLHRPERWSGVDVRDCDDGIVLLPSGVVCNRARFGHLSVLLRGAARSEAVWPIGDVRIRGEAGMRWTPSFRSSTALELVGTSSETIELRAETGVRVF